MSINTDLYHFIVNFIVYLVTVHTVQTLSSNADNTYNTTLISFLIIFINTNLEFHTHQLVSVDMRLGDHQNPYIHSDL